MNCLFAQSDAIISIDPTPILHPAYVPLAPSSMLDHPILIALTVWSILGFALGHLFFGWADKARWRYHLLTFLSGPIVWGIWMPVYLAHIELAIIKQRAANRAAAKR